MESKPIEATLESTTDTLDSSQKWLAGLKKYILVGMAIVLVICYLAYGPLKKDPDVGKKGLDTIVVLAGLGVSGTVASKFAGIKGKK